MLRGELMIDPDREHMITFSEASRRVPGGVHRATISRWGRRGVGPRKIRLEFIKLAGRYRTSVEALDRFLAACQSDGWDGIASAFTYEQVLAAKKCQDAKQDISG